MSLPHLIQTDARSYLVADDRTSLYCALVMGAAQDAVTGEAPASELRVSTANPNAAVRVLDGGMFGLTGDPARVFPQGNTASSLDLILSAAGYRPVALTVPVPAGAVFPIRLPAPILLDPLPARLQGRVVTNTAVPTPIPNARVTIVDPTLAAPDHVLVLRSPLRLAHAANTPVRGRVLTPTGGIRRLVAPAAAASQTLLLDARAGLGVNTVLRLGTDPAVEFAVIEALNPIPANPNLPGEVYLRFPLYHSFAAGSEVRQISPGAIGAGAALSREQESGEALLVLNAALAADTIEVADADPARVEYHAVGARTNGEGYYRLDGIARARVAQVRADSGAQNATRAVRLDYRRGVTYVDFSL